jgi:endoglucanase
MFGDIQRLFLDKNIPVIIGETGAMIKNGNTADRLEWAKHYFGKAREFKIPVYLWDNGLFQGGGELYGLMERKYAKFVFPEIIDAVNERVRN